MLSFDDCVGLSQLTTEEIAAIARHEHLPEIAALEMGWSLCGSPEGEQLIRRMILEDIEDARRRGEAQEAATLRLVLRHFEETHPGRPGRRRSPVGRQAVHGTLQPCDRRTVIT